MIWNGYGPLAAQSGELKPWKARNQPSSHPRMFSTPRCKKKRQGRNGKCGLYEAMAQKKIQTKVMMVAEISASTAADLAIRRWNDTNEIIWRLCHFLSTFPMWYSFVEICGILNCTLIRRRSSVLPFDGSVGLGNKRNGQENGWSGWAQWGTMMCCRFCYIFLQSNLTVKKWRAGILRKQHRLECGTTLCRK